MKDRISYLTQLTFDPRLWNTFQGRYLTQIRLVVLLILSIVTIGLFAYLNIPRRLNPEIKIPIVIVSTILPGASPEDTESLLTVPLEDKIKNIKGIDTMTSSSRESSSSIVIQFLSTVDGEKAKNDVKSAVDTVTTLPKDAKTPSVQKLDFEDQPIWTFAILTDSDPASLMRFTKNLKTQIEDLPKVDRVVVAGYDEQDIEVIIDQIKIKENGINAFQVSQAVQAAASAYPAGNIETGVSSFALSIDRDLVTVEDIRNIRLTVAGKSIRLGDIARVGYRSRLNQNSAYFTSRGASVKQVVQFFVYRASTANIDASEKEVRARVEEELKKYNRQFTLVTINNSAEEITTQFDELSNDFISTIVLVFILLFIFLGFRQAAIASITVPLTLLSAFAIINAFGLTLNFLTMFAFLIALGLLIDDTIVVVAAMTRYYATGKFTPAQAGILVWKDFIVPLWSTTITTIWAFLPLILSTGIIGEFIKSIPIVVTATMISSTTIAVFITIPLMIVFLKPSMPRRVKIFLTGLMVIALVLIPVFILPKNPVIFILVPLFLLLIVLTYRIRNSLREELTYVMSKREFTKKLPGQFRRMVDHGVLDIEKISHGYMVLIERIILSKHGKRNTLIGLTIFTVVAYLLVPLGFVQNEFFPSQDSDLLYVSVELPSGTNLKTNTGEMLSLLHEVKNTTEVSFAVGESGQGFSSQGRVGDPSSFLITLHLTDHKKRHISSQKIAQDLRVQLKNYARGVLTVQELSGGPPAGADIQITYLGDDLTVLDGYANQTMDFLKKQPGLTNVDKSIKPGTSKLVFVPNKESLIENGLTVDSVASWLRIYASGMTLDTVKFGEDEEDIVLRLSDDTQTPEGLGALAIPTVKGSVPLVSLGKLQLSTNPTVITRDLGKRTISVTGSVVTGVNAQTKGAELEKFANSLNLPSGYSWKTGGVNDENQKSVNSILQAMLVSFLLILITLVVEFRSFRQAFIALLIIPLSIAGVFYVFALTQTPLSFPALIGILALFGIVITHAIVVIEKINDNIREGLNLEDAIIDAAGNRLEPVLLTSLATIVGLIPITLSDPLWRGLGGAIIAGLLFSGLIKLFFVPVMYYMFFKEKK